MIRDEDDIPCLSFLHAPCPAGNRARACYFCGQQTISCFVYAKSYGALGSLFRSFPKAYISTLSWMRHLVLPEKYALMLSLECSDGISPA